MPNDLTGLTTEADKKVPVTVRDWDAMKRAAWRSRSGWEIAAREASTIVARCAHMPGCPGKESEDEPCLADCPDRELRCSALVILGAARQCAPTDARRPADAPYFAPSREYFSDVLSQLAAAQAELAALRAAGHVVEPPPNDLKESP